MRLAAFFAATVLVQAYAPSTTTATFLVALVLTRPRAARPVADDAREIDIDAVFSRSRVIQRVTSWFLVSLLCRSRLVVGAAGLELSWRFGRHLIPWHAIRHAEAEAAYIRLDLEGGGAVELPTRVSGTPAALAANFTIADIIEESLLRAGSPYRAAGARAVSG